MPQNAGYMFAAYIAAGFTPVSRLAQATGDSGGSSLRRGWNEPSRASAARCGSSLASR